jgi:hypothetical protein
MCPLTFPTGKALKCDPLNCAWFLDERCAIVDIADILRNKLRFQ